MKNVNRFKISQFTVTTYLVYPLIEIPSGSGFATSSYGMISAAGDRMINTFTLEMNEHNMMKIHLIQHKTRFTSLPAPKELDEARVFN